jgi:hypothetical protein
MLKGRWFWDPGNRDKTLPGNRCKAGTISRRDVAIANCISTGGYVKKILQGSRSEY